MNCKIPYCVRWRMAELAMLCMNEHHSNCIHFVQNRYKMVSVSQFRMEISHLIHVLVWVELILSQSKKLLCHGECTKPSSKIMAKSSRGLFNFILSNSHFTQILRMIYLWSLMTTGMKFNMNIPLTVQS